MSKTICAVIGLAAGILLAAPAEPGFTTLFNGKDLTGWKLVGQEGRGYIVEDGLLECPADGGGNLFTEKEYANFVFRFEFKLEEGSNNGIGIRAPYEGDAAYQGMEIQILDYDAPTLPRQIASRAISRFHLRRRTRQNRLPQTHRPVE